MTPTLVVDVRDRVVALRARIERAGGDPDAVRLVAVTKGFGVDVVRAALAAGLEDLGESYVQELVVKAAALEAGTGERGGAQSRGGPASVGQGGVVAAAGGHELAGPRPRWHFIGRLQRNKVRKAAPHVVLWHSVDRMSLGTEIARWAREAAVLVQVNTSAEPTKGGCPPTMLPGLVDGLVDLGLDVRGLMTLGPAGPPEAARPAFRALRELAGRLGLPELSMGMSGDLEVAVEEGATIVRVGSDLFGPRPDRAGVRH